MVKSTGIKGGPIVLKKILLMSCALLALVGATVVHAAPRITKVAYGVSPDRQLRVVLETTTPARMRSEFIERNCRLRSAHGSIQACPVPMSPRMRPMSVRLSLNLKGRRPWFGSI